MISIIMPCHLANEQHIVLTVNAIESLGEDRELIIVDDASPLGGGFLRSVADVYIRNKTNLGYGISVNRGLRQAQSQQIAIANNDIRISPNWRSVVNEVFAEDEDIYSCHFRMTDYDVPFEYGSTISLEKQRWCHASFFVINTAKAKFYYDEHYFNTYDDWDYFQNVRSQGLKQAYTDRAVFQHVHSATIPYLPKHTERNRQNAEYFKSKWGGYAEELFERDFPEQMRVPYPEGFRL